MARRSRFRLGPQTVGAIIALILFVVVLYLDHTYKTRYPRPIYRFTAVPDHACDSVGMTSAVSKGDRQRYSIPRLVHYVWLLKEPASFSLNFKAFVSIYSAYVRWKPDKIYIHTDAAPEIVARATTDGDAWTKRILGLPSIMINHVTTPHTTSEGVDIVQMEHKSDFVRIEALRDFGGIYLDIDCVPLRDISELLDSGYANVVGGQAGLTMRSTGYIDNGIMMSIPNSTLMKIFYEASHRFFDGRWTTASTDLLTDIAKRLLPLPSEVLILHSEAFAPTSWEIEDVKRLFMPQPNLLPAKLPKPDHGAGVGGAGGELFTPTCLDALTWLREREGTWSESGGGGSGTRRLQDSWELDLSSSYVLHAFDDELRNIRGGGWDLHVNVAYVLARQSNYARIVFPVVWHALQAGIIPQEEAVG